MIFLIHVRRYPVTAPLFLGVAVLDRPDRRLPGRPLSHSVWKTP